MTRKATRRKHYAAVPIVAHVIEGVRPISDKKDLQLQEVERRALEAFRTGTATAKDWTTMADVVNVAETLAGMGVGRDEVTPVLKEVEQHLFEAHERFLRIRRIGTTGPGLHAMEELLEFHRLQRTSIDLVTLERALNVTAQRIRAGHPSVKVCVSERQTA